jgi:hypothetical protein
MVETEEKLETIEVVKRNGKKVEFDGTKVALAIKKGFDSILHFFCFLVFLFFLFLCFLHFLYFYQIMIFVSYIV